MLYFRPHSSTPYYWFIALSTRAASSRKYIIKDSELRKCDQTAPSKIDKMLIFCSACPKFINIAEPVDTDPSEKAKPSTKSDSCCQY